MLSVPNKPSMMSVIMLNVAFSYWYAECRYAEWRYAECRGALQRSIHLFIPNTFSNVANIIKLFLFYFTYILIAHAYSIRLTHRIQIH